MLSAGVPLINSVGALATMSAVTLKGDYLSIPDIDPGMLRGMKCKIAVDNRSRHRLYKSCLRLRVFIKVNTGEH